MMTKISNFLLWIGVVLSLLGLATTTGYYFSGIIHLGVTDAVHFVDVALLTLRVFVTGMFYAVAFIISLLWLDFDYKGLDVFKDDSKASDTV